MDHLNLFETEPGAWSLILYSGDLPADETVESLGHVPHGFFWNDVARWLIETELQELDGRLEFDSEGGMFCACGHDRDALEQLRLAMVPLVEDGERVRRLVAAAEAAGFTFDD